MIIDFSFIKLISYLITTHSIGHCLRRHQSLLDITNTKHVMFSSRVNVTKIYV